MSKKYLTLEDARFYYDEKHDNFRMITKDERFKGLPFQLTITKDSETEESLRKVMIEEQIIQKEFNLSKPQIVTKDIFTNNHSGKFLIGKDRTGKDLFLDSNFSPITFVEIDKNDNSSYLIYNNILHNVIMNPDFYEATICNFNKEEYSYNDFLKNENVSIFDPNYYRITASGFIDFLYNKVLFNIKNPNKNKRKTLYLIDKLPNGILEDATISEVFINLIRIARSHNIFFVVGIPVGYSYQNNSFLFDIGSIISLGSKKCIHPNHKSQCISCKVSKMNFEYGQGIVRYHGYDTPVSLFFTHEITTTPENINERLEVIQREVNNNNI